MGSVLCARLWALVQNLSSRSLGYEDSYLFRNRGCEDQTQAVFTAIRAKVRCWLLATSNDLSAFCVVCRVLYSPHPHNIFHTK